jgi:hypothetical protein
VPAECPRSDTSTFTTVVPWLFVNKCSLGTAPVHDFFEGAAGKVRTYFSLFLLIYADKEYLHRGHKPKEGEREREYIKSNSLATN